MSNQLLHMPTAPAVARGDRRGGDDGHFQTKRDTYMVFSYAGSPTKVHLNWLGSPRVRVPLNPLIIALPVMNPQPEVATLTSTIGAEEAKLISEKVAAIRAFKGGAALLAGGAIAAAATVVVAAPFLSGVSAVLTMAGGTIAAGATERYRRGG